MLDSLRARVRGLIRAIQDDDEAAIERILRLSRSRRAFAPLAFTVGAFAMLFDGLRLLISNWRLTLVQVLPAVWIWLAMYDLRARVLHGRSFPSLRGPPLIPVGAGIVAITVGCFFCNAVFAFAIAHPGPPRIAPAWRLARDHALRIAAWGVALGTPLAVATTIAPRWPKPWFSIALGATIGAMMICYVAVPARLIGLSRNRTPRERIASGALGAVLSATVCTPPYLLGRLGILMLGSRALLIPGIVLLTVGFGLQAGATGAVRAIKMSAVLAVGPTRDRAHRGARG